jgi:RecA-family ATPase
MKHAEKYILDRFNGGGEVMQLGTPLESLAFRASDLKGQEVPVRQWEVANYIPTGVPVLLYGDGGVGKTNLALQLGICRAAGLPWLGLETEPGRTLMFAAEDDKNELHIRLNDIRSELGVKWDDIGDFVVVPVAGEDFVLGEGDARGQRVMATPRLAEVERLAYDKMSKLIILDTLSDIYAGEESDRSQVRQFIGLLRGICKRAEVTILMLAHPSLSGMASGTGTSGSTGWNNGVRSRLYFKGGDDGTKTLTVMKANYGPKDIGVTLRWENGLYVPVTAGDVTANEEGDDMAFLSVFDAYTKQGRGDVSPFKSPTWAPSLFAADKKLCGKSTKEMEAAMNRLLAAGRIKIDTFGPPSKQRSRLVKG